MQMLSSRIATLILGFILMSTVAIAQNLSLTSSNFPGLPATSCTNTQLDVSIQLLCGNMTHTGNSVNIAGSTITVDISYTLGPICLPVILTATQNINLGLIPAGTYSVVINGKENNSTVSTINTTLSVASCCGASAAFTPTKSMVCQGDSVFFNNMSTGGTGYTWYENNVQVSTDTSFGKVYAAVGTYNIKLVVADVGCADSITKTIVVGNTLPVIDLGPDESLCPGKTKILDSGSGRDSVLWSDNSTLRSLIVSQPGTYYVTVYKNGCSNTDTIVLTDASTPFDLGNDTTICFGDTLVLDVTLSGASYIWQDNSTSPTFKVSTAGSYYVKRTNSDGCASWDTIAVSIDSCNSGLWENSLTANDVHVYPNPVKDVLSISIKSDQLEITGVNIVNVQGRVVKQLPVPDENRFGIDVTDLPGGVYILNIESAGGIIAKKWIKS